MSFGTRATEFIDENREDRPKSFIHCDGGEMEPCFYPMLDKEYYNLDTPPGWVEMRAANEDNDTCKINLCLVVHGTVL